jgi:predicted dehydrogenase
MSFTRRILLRRTAVLSLGTAFAPLATVRAAEPAGRKLRVAVVGLGRGYDHVMALLKIPGVEIAYLAEVDPQRLARSMKAVAAQQGPACRGVTDFRGFLADKSLDAVFIATPNHWHTPAAVLALQAGKHVYVEKPGSQNPHEAELLVAAARKHGRLVQLGNQRRTWMKEAVEALHGGAIGKLRFARCFYYNSRGPVRQGANPAPPELDLELWQGPVAEDRELRPYLHYDWHWLWNWGNGELGNNGVHHLDILRWGLQVDYPRKVSYTGGRYWHADTQETPDTGTAVFDCGETGMEWVQSSSFPRAAEKPLHECLFYGERGTFGISGSAWTIYDPKGVKTGEGKGPSSGDVTHIGNFLAAIRDEAKLNSPIDEGQKSAMLCHLGNLAYRTNSVLQIDPATGRIIGNPAAEKLWKRDYRPGWEPVL